METRGKLFKLWGMIKGHLGSDTLKKVAREFPEFSKEAIELARERQRINEEFKKFLDSHRQS